VHAVGTEVRVGQALGADFNRHVASFVHSEPQVEDSMEKEAQSRERAAVRVLNGGILPGGG
jgi:hypothetical protein